MFKDIRGLTGAHPRILLGGVYRPPPPSIGGIKLMGSHPSTPCPPSPSPSSTDKILQKLLNSVQYINTQPVFVVQPNKVEIHQHYFKSCQT